MFLRWFAQKKPKNSQKWPDAEGGALFEPFSLKIWYKLGKKGKKNIIEVIFVYFMIDSSHKHVRECKKTALKKKNFRTPHRGPLSGALGVQNRPMTAIAYKIHSYGDRKLKIGMNVDEM